MAKIKISGKELIKLGYPEGRAIGMAINVVHQHFKKEKKEKVLAMLKDLLETRWRKSSQIAISRLHEINHCSSKSSAKRLLRRNFRHPHTFAFTGHLNPLCL